MTNQPLPPNSFRLATDDDLDVVGQLEKQVHKAPWTLDHFRAELTKPYSRFLVLTDDETDSLVIGYIVFWVMEGDAHILNVVVDPRFQRQGMGQKLVRQAIRIGLQEGAKKSTLEVRRSNAAALELYQSVGFLVVQVAKGFYSDGEDAYLMALEFTGEVIRL